MDDLVVDSQKYGCNHLQLVFRGTHLSGTALLARRSHQIDHLRRWSAGCLLCRNIFNTEPLSSTIVHRAHSANLTLWPKRTPDAKRHSTDLTIKKRFMKHPAELVACGSMVCVQPWL